MAFSFNGTDITYLVFNGTKIDKLIFNGTTVWESKTIEEILVDFTYTNNGNNTYTITGWKGTYNGTASTECIIPDDSRIIL